jgi:hypothetical protein
MFQEKSAISDKTRGNLVKLVSPLFKFEKGNELNQVISEVLSDKDLFLYMATHSIKNSGIILGRMSYFDDISVEVPYGITYDFKNPSLNIFTFDFCAFREAKKPIETLNLYKSLPSKRSMGINTEENYSNYPTVNSFLTSLNDILQKEIKEQTPFWVDFNEHFYS